MIVTQLRFCKDHFDRMKEAVDTRGLMPLVSSNGGVGIQRMIDAATTGSRPDNFDPLMSVHNTILFNAIGLLGIRSFDTRDGEPTCPLCLLREVHEQECPNPGECDADFDSWIDLAADDAKLQLDEMMQGRPS